jgi:hypothetical protein
MKGYRKVIVFSEALAGFILSLWLLKPVEGLVEPGVIYAVGTQIALLLAGAIYGNVKEHQNGHKPQ